MAPFIRFVMNRKTLQCAIVAAGDERVTFPLPQGWEEILPRSVIKSDEEFQKWLYLSAEDRLRRLCSEGYTPVFPKDGTTWDWHKLETIDHGPATKESSDFLKQWWWVLLLFFPIAVLLYIRMRSKN